MGTALGIDKVWRNIVNGGVIKSGVEGRQWTLKDGSSWMDKVEILYNRPYYDSIVKQMKDKDMVLIKGTPGTGKSTFLERMMVEIVENSRAANVALPKIVLAMLMGSGVVEFALNNDGTVEHFDRANGDPQFYLSDSVDSDAKQGTKLHLLVASSKDKNYNKFIKHVQPRESGLDINMNLFEFEELCAISGSMTREEATFRYLIVGGSARRFKTYFPVNVEILPFVKETMQWICSGTSFEKDFPDTFQGYCLLISQELTKSADGVTEVINSLMRHSASGQRMWASQYMKFLGAEVIRCRETTLYNELKQIVKNGGIGNCFESLVHRKFTSPGFVCTAKPLYPPNQRVAKGGRDGVKHKFDYPVVLVRNIEDIENLANERYGLPIFDNFPLVDAIIQPDTLIQITVCPNVHKGAVEELPRIRTYLKEKDGTKHKMIFVVPSMNVGKFKYQLDLKDISQYIATDNEVASILSLLSEGEMAQVRKYTKKRNAVELTSGVAVL